jgi:hypothetical protein
MAMPFGKKDGNVIGWSALSGEQNICKWEKRKLREFREENWEMISNKVYKDFW